MLPTSTICLVRAATTAMPIGCPVLLVPHLTAKENRPVSLRHGDSQWSIFCIAASMERIMRGHLGARTKLSTKDSARVRVIVRDHPYGPRRSQLFRSRLKCPICLRLNGYSDKVCDVHCMDRAPGCCGMGQKSRRSKADARGYVGSGARKNWTCKEKRDGRG